MGVYVYFMNNLSNFSERLKELLFDNDITPEQLATAIDVARSTVYRWTAAPMQITRANLIAVSNYFKCSIEYLTGRSFDTRELKPKDCPPFALHIHAVMKEKGFTTYSLRKVSRFDGSYFRKWEAGEEPGLPLLIELAKLFDCTLDYLVGRED
ncbi:MAG: XRE family transcriptional regulator [Firmicutes bacterium]|nr:XRE family transcriptional regulator [Bacillota bacterium]